MIINKNKVITKKLEIQYQLSKYIYFQRIILFILNIFYNSQIEALKAGDLKINFFSEESKIQDIASNAPITFVETPKNEQIINLAKGVSNRSQTNKTIDIQAAKKFQDLVCNLVDDNYFKEDFKQRKEQMMKNVQIEHVMTKHFFEQFTFSFFIEFFLYHIIYFLVLGPLACPLINLRGKALSRNMGFIGKGVSVYFQFVIFLTNFTSIVLFIVMGSERISFQVEIYNIIGITLTRSLVIACKYGTYDALKMKVFRKSLFTEEQKKADLYLLGWVSQTPQVIHNQVYQCQRAFDIDPSLFFVQFMVDPEQNTHDRLMEHDKILLKARSNDQYCEIKPIPIIKQKKGEKFYFGYALLKDLIDTFQENNKTFKSTVVISVVLFGLFRALLPIGFRVYYNPSDPYLNPHEYFIAVFSAYQVANMFIVTALQGSLGFIDTSRKLFMQRQLSFMIAPRKLKNLDMKKILPTINIFHSGSMKGWTLIRKVCMEYGKGFSLRVQGLFTFLGAWSLACLLCVFLTQFKFIASFESIFMYQIYADLIVSLILNFALILNGAKINAVFDLQESILNSNKTIISDLNLVVQGLLNDAYHSQSYIYTKALERILEQDENNPQQSIEKLLKHYDFHINELLHDKKHNPFTLFGIKVTFLMLESAAIAIGSLGATLISTLQQKD